MESLSRDESSNSKKSILILVRRDGNFFYPRINNDHPTLIFLRVVTSLNRAVRDIDKALVALSIISRGLNTILTPS